MRRNRHKFHMGYVLAYVGVFFWTYHSNIATWVAMQTRSEAVVMTHPLFLGRMWTKH